MIKTLYDPETDAVFMRLSDMKIHESEEVSPNIIVDYDTEGRIVGIEFLNAHKNLAKDIAYDSFAHRA